MKKNFLLLLFFFTIFGCDKKDKSDPEPVIIETPSILGRWEIDKDQEIEPDGSINDEDFDKGYFRFEGNEYDGTYFYQYETQPVETGTYRHEINSALTLSGWSQPWKVEVYTTNTLTIFRLKADGWGRRLFLKKRI